MMRELAAIVFGALVVSAIPSRADDGPPSVSALGSPDRVTVQGASTFSEAEIVRELFADIDVANAAYPAAPLDEFRQLLTEKTLAGYRHAGFAEANVKSNVDETLNRIVLSVEEGPRYLASGIDVSGLPEADAAWLREKLTPQPQSREQEASFLQPADTMEEINDRAFRWPTGKPARCDSETLLQYRRWIEDTWFGRGFLFADFTLAVRLDQERRQAPPDNVGPLWYLSGAAAARLAGMNGAATRCALEGMRHLSSQEFRRDWAGLYDRNCLLGKSLVNALKALSQLKESEAELIGQALITSRVIKEEHRDELVAWLNHLRLRGELKDEDVDAAIGSLWEVALEDGVGWALRKLAGPRQKETSDAPPATAQQGDQASGPAATKADANPVYEMLSPFGPARKLKAHHASGLKR